LLYSRIKMSSVLNLDLANLSVTWGNIPVKVNPHWFEVYVLLSLEYSKHSQDPSKYFVHVDRVHKLSSWKDLKFQSVRKSLHRHIERQKVPIMTSPPGRSTSLFGINVDIVEDIQFDRGDAVSWLERQTPKEDRFYRTEQSATLVLAEIRLRQGDNHLAQNMLTVLSSQDLLPDDRLTLKVLMSELHERRNEHEQAWGEAQKALELMKQDASSLQTAARVHTRLGQLYIADADNEQAFKHYHKARTLLAPDHDLEQGYVETGLGVLEVRRGKFAVGKKHHEKALHHWLRARWWYGVHIVYFNLALLYWRQAFHKLGEPSKKQREYLEQAESWLTHCISFREINHVGRDTAFPHILMAAIKRSLGNLDSSRRWWEAAEDIVEEKNLHLDRGYLLLEYAEMAVVEDKVCDARRALGQAKLIFEEANDSIRVRAVEEKLEEIARG